MPRLTAASEGCSGAELVGAFRDACLLAIEESRDAGEVRARACEHRAGVDPAARAQLCLRHVEAAMARVTRGITPAMLKFYSLFSM